MFPHEKHEPAEYGRSPGNGVTAIPLSRDPLATEGEATPGPDDYNPYEDFDRPPRPTDGRDPYAFDDVEDEVDDVNLPFFDPPGDLDFLG